MRKVRRHNKRERERLSQPTHSHFSLMQLHPILSLQGLSHLTIFRYPIHSFTPIQVATSSASHVCLYRMITASLCHRIKQFRPILFTPHMLCHMDFYLKWPILGQALVSLTSLRLMHCTISTTLCCCIRVRQLQLMRYRTMHILCLTHLYLKHLSLGPISANLM